MSRFESRRDAKLKQLAQAKPFVAASLCHVKRRCGHPGCKCAHGHPHTAWVLTYKDDGKTVTVHVPKDLLEEVKQWVKEYHRVKALIRQVSHHSVTIIRHHVPASRAAAPVPKQTRR